MFACRTCQFSEEAPSSCVFRNNLYNTVGETAGVTQDVGSDPTVGGFFFNSSYVWRRLVHCVVPAFGRKIMGTALGINRRG